MSLSVNIHNPDSTSQQPVIQIQRTDVDIQGGFSIDSSRLQAIKTVTPVKKTIPFVPVTDTLPHPVYNVVDNAFVLTPDNSLISRLKLNPVEPLQADGFTNARPKPIRIQHSVTVPDKSIIRKETREKNSSGFENTDWMFGVIVLSLFLFAWIRVVYGRFVSLVTQATYNYFTARRMFDESNAVRSRVFVFFNLLFFVNIGLFASQSLDFFNMNPPAVRGLVLFAISFGAFLLLYSLKTFLLKLLDFIFLTQGGFGSYNFTVFLYNKLYGLLLIPVISVLPFVSFEVARWLIYLGVLLFVLFYFFRILRGIQIGIKNRLSIFYLFLYLCALEILPLLLVYKIVTTYS